MGNKQNRVSNCGFDEDSSSEHDSDLLLSWISFHRRRMRKKDCDQPKTCHEINSDEEERATEKCIKCREEEAERRRKAVEKKRKEEENEEKKAREQEELEAKKQCKKEERDRKLIEKAEANSGISCQNDSDLLLSWISFHRRRMRKKDCDQPKTCHEINSDEEKRAMEKCIKCREEKAERRRKAAEKKQEIEDQRKNKQKEDCERKLRKKAEANRLRAEKKQQNCKDLARKHAEKEQCKRNKIAEKKKERPCCSICTSCCFESNEPCSSCNSTPLIIHGKKIQHQDVQTDPIEYFSIEEKSQRRPEKEYNFNCLSAKIGIPSKKFEDKGMQTDIVPPDLVLILPNTPARIHTQGTQLNYYELNEISPTEKIITPTGNQSIPTCVCEIFNEQNFESISAPQVDPYRSNKFYKGTQTEICMCNYESSSSDIFLHNP